MDAIVVFARFCTEEKETEMDLSKTHEPETASTDGGGGVAPQRHVIAVALATVATAEG
ncbi:hypothetical protein AAG906_026206 [Vitis piasezkii]